MAPQADLVIANQSGSAFRADLNNQLAALGTLMSGSSAPSTTYAYMLWADTTNGVLKIRNSANNAWVSLFKLDGTDICKLTGSTDNQITTVTGANAIQGEANLTFDGSTLLVKNAIKVVEASGSEYYQLVTNSYGGLEIQNETTKIAEFTDSNILELQDNLKFADGKGIDFSATSGTGTSELLGDYEEGTWTPWISFGGGSDNVVYGGSNGGYYIKIGRFVWVHGRVHITDKGDSTGASKLRNLPFTCGNRVSGSSSVEGGVFFTYQGNWMSGLDYHSPLGYIVVSTTDIELYYRNNSGDLTAIDDSDWENTTSIGFEGFYPV